MATLIHGILQKFPAGFGSVALSFTDSRGVQTTVDDEVVHQLPNGQDLVVEFLNGGLRYASKPATQIGSVNANSSKPLKGWCPESVLQTHSSSSFPLIEEIFLSEPPSADNDLDYLIIDPSLPVECNPSEVDSDRTWVADTESTTFGPCTFAISSFEDQWSGLCDSSEREPTDRSSFQLSSQPLAEAPDDVPEQLKNRIVPRELETLASCSNAVDSAAFSAAKPESAEAGKRSKKPSKRPRDIEEVKREIILEKNREAATKCRARRKVKEEERQGELEKKIQENNLLRDTMLELQAQVDVMTEILAVHEACMDYELPNPSNKQEVSAR